MPGDLCKRRGGEIAAERDDALAVEAPPYTVARVGS
jgi:hypothetical protein